MLASKFREPLPLSAESLVYYTDNSITLDDLCVSPFFFSRLSAQKQSPLKDITLRYISSTVLPITNLHYFTNLKLEQIELN